MIRTAHGRAAFYVLAFAAMVFAWHAIDIPLILWHEEQSRAAERIWDVITSLGDGVTPLVPSFLLWVGFRHFGRKRAARLALFVFTATLAAAVATDILKPIFGRARPTLLEDGLFGFFWWHIRYEYISFPSGHATTAVASMSALAYIFPRHRFWFAVAAVIVAYSRIAVGKHYLSDVIMGAVVGIFVTEWVYRRFLKKEREKDEPFDPALFPGVETR